VIKHSDDFVWKDTSERVTRRCDDTVGKKRVNSCVVTKLLFGGSWPTKISENPRKCTFRRATNVTFSKFRDWRRQNENHAPRGFLKTALRAVLIISLINSLIRINSGPKILRSCFLHWHESFVVLVRCLNLLQTTTSCTPAPPTPRHYQNRSLGAANLPITCHHDVSFF